ncbi:pyridoxamine 5'-phosphate oxidase family protein [Streptomyces sp. NPDC051561]|uniref:pyridoxamine 5'-phosphate oxidase family protein n=1 Tax=Streptomyces sp. NPDC051561 TaxID=3365658 RepID=UPI00378C2768
MTTYHRGEVAVQNRAGLREPAEFSRGALGNTVPDVAAAFLAEQPFVILGAADLTGRLWATQLTGAPGFLRAPQPQVLTLDALPFPEDPLADALTGPASSAVPVRTGMIAIEPATRRRMRMNGRALRQGAGLRVELDQVVANCPKYLQKRSRQAPALRSAPHTRTATDGTALTPAQQQTVTTADTFFIATASLQGDADASHRGGNPGFVEVLSPTLLRWPDYTGNSMFLTLGNLAVNPAAGLVFPNWETGSLLHLSGTARTDWDTRASAPIPGAQRLVEFTVEAVREISHASPLRWSAPTYSRFNPPTR